jgi:hypothetical protein
MRLFEPSRQGLRRLSPESRRGALPFGDNSLQFQGLSPLACDDDQVDAPREEARRGLGRSSREAEALPAQALDPVPGNGVSHTPRDDEAQTRRGGGHRRGLGRDQENEVRRRDAPRAGLDALEIGALSYASRAVERGGRGRRGSSGSQAPLTSCTRPPPAASFPCGGDSRGPSARQRSPCGHGSRAFGRGERCAVDRCASCGFLVGPRREPSIGEIVKHGLVTCGWGPGPFLYTCGLGPPPQTLSMGYTCFARGPRRGVRWVGRGVGPAVPRTAVPPVTPRGPHKRGELRVEWHEHG